MSDKLRAAIATLKRLQDGESDYNGALEMHREMCKSVRQQLAGLESQLGHSEVMAAILEHVPSLAATLTAACVETGEEARRLESQLTQRCFQLVESLMRQAVTREARAYDKQVISKHVSPLIELGMIIHQSTVFNEEGN